MANQKDGNGASAQGRPLSLFETRVSNLLALVVVGGKKQTEQIRLLGRAGFGAAEIAVLLGTTRNTVSVELSKQRHETQSRRKNKAK